MGGYMNGKMGFRGHLAMKVIRAKGTPLWKRLLDKLRGIA